MGDFTGDRTGCFDNTGYGDSRNDDVCPSENNNNNKKNVKM